MLANRILVSPMCEYSSVDVFANHWQLGPANGGWQPVGRGVEPFATAYPTPRPIATAEVSAIVGAFRDAARRARDVGMDVVEIHAAHGYLIHEFLSPLTNSRSDRY